MQQLLPLFLKLEGRRVVVVGAGSVGASKALAFLGCGAAVTVVAPTIDVSLREPGVTLVERGFRPADLDGAWLAVAAAPPEVNRAVARAAEKRRLFVNVVDDLELASAYLGGVTRRGGVTVAVSTEGVAPALAGLIREALDALIPEDVARWVEVSGRERAHWRAAGLPHASRRPLLLAALNRLYEPASLRGAVDAGALGSSS
jgi:siroheme synthase-like protein